MGSCPLGFFPSIHLRPALSLFFLSIFSFISHIHTVFSSCPHTAYKSSPCHIELIASEKGAVVPKGEEINANSSASARLESGASAGSV